MMDALVVKKFVTDIEHYRCAGGMSCCFNNMKQKPLLHFVAGLLAHIVTSVSYFDPPRLQIQLWQVDCGATVLNTKKDFQDFEDLHEVQNWKIFENFVISTSGQYNVVEEYFTESGPFICVHSVHQPVSLMCFNFFVNSINMHLRVFHPDRTN